MTNYPEHCISNYQSPDGIAITLRPVKGEDSDLMQDFFRHLSSQTIHSHFYEDFKELSKEALLRLTQIDYDRVMVFIATFEQNNNVSIIGMAQYAATPTPEECEALVIIADGWHRKGIAKQLMQCLTEAAKENGFKKMIASIPAVNVKDLDFARTIGFSVSTSEEPTQKIVTKILS